MISIAVVSNYILPSDYMTAYTIAIANHLLRVFSIRSWNHTCILYIHYICVCCKRKAPIMGLAWICMPSKCFCALVKMFEEWSAGRWHMWLKCFHNCVVNEALLWFGVGTFWENVYIFGCHNHTCMNSHLLIKFLDLIMQTIYWSLLYA